MSKHLLVINFTMDENHPSLSHQREVVQELAKYFNEVSVITGSASDSPIPPNVKIYKIKWREGSLFWNSARLLYQFYKLILVHRPSVMFSHMVPIHSAMLAPISRIVGVKHVLWYAHAKTPLSLRVANIFVDKILSSTPGSCNIKSDKVDFIGQGVDANVFTFKDRNFAKFQEVLYVGRLDPSKNVKLIVSAVENARKSNPNLRLTLVGSSNSSETLFNSDWISVTGPVPRITLPSVYSSADVFLHAFQGSLDKVLVEAALNGLPIVTVNEEFTDNFEIFGAIPNSLETQLMNLLASPAGEISQIVQKNYRLAIYNHEIKGWSIRLVAALNS